MAQKSALTDTAGDLFNSAIKLILTTLCLQIYRNRKVGWKWSQSRIAREAENRKLRKCRTPEPSSK